MSDSASLTFDLPPLRRAKFSFSVNAAWENYVKVTNPLNGEVINRGNFGASTADYLTDFNNTGGNVTFLLFSQHKVVSSGHFPFIDNFGKIISESDLEGVRKILFGYKDQPQHQEYNNVRIEVTIF